MHFRIHEDAKTTADGPKVIYEYDAAREEMALNLASWRLRRHARIGLQRSRCCAQITRIFERKSGRVRIPFAILNWMVRNPYGACSRFALGALKNAALRGSQP